MGALLELPGQPPSSLLLYTRLGQPIDNAQGSAVPFGGIMAFRDMCKERNWDLRRDSDGLYNCAGLVWANRRTGISEQQSWLRILREDGYRQVTDGARLSIDDLVLYLDTIDRIYVHVARIIELKPGVAESSPPFAMVISKWGHQLGECYHAASNHQLGDHIEFQFWTDRPTDDVDSATARSRVV